jgi:hypothetical protein
MATRSPGQKLIPVPASDQFILRLKTGIKKAGFTNRSQFIRDAVVEKLERHGIKVPASMASPPQRAGRVKPMKPKGKPVFKARKPRR